MLLIDSPSWPAHGTEFAHLVSDASLTELHAFAASTGVSLRAFDHDHYDVPAHRHAGLVAAGAAHVESTELVRRLRASGLRLGPHDRTPKRRTVLPRLRRAWVDLLPEASRLDGELLARWAEEHRRYHDVRHLAHVLQALDAVGAPGRPVRLAAWFHDAVHTGTAGADEEASARLAEDALAGLVPRAEAGEVARLVRLTATHDPESGDAAGAALVDADLAILAVAPGRYQTYARDIRLEYAHVDDAGFRDGRLAVLDRLLAGPLFRSSAAAGWDAPARTNLRSESDALQEGWNLARLEP